MKVLSLFDGISCARVALERAGIPVEEYYASEIDKYAIQISQKNYPDIRHIGDVAKINATTHDPFDLLIGGSPCQDLSIAGKRKGLNGERSGLFYEYVRILKENEPEYFILENVASMSKEAKETITKELFGIEPVMINASLVSAQNRKRLFWVGKLVGDTYQKVEIPQPEDRGILLKDILEDEVDEKYFLNEKNIKNLQREFGSKGKILDNSEQKSPTLTASMGTGGGNVNTIRVGQLNSGGQGDRIYSQPESIKPKGNYLQIRKLTPIECERLQSLKDGFSSGVSNTQRYKCLGNAFNVEVVAHIIKELK